MTTTSTRFEKPPDLIIDAPLNYENNHLLPECPFCKTPDPYLDMVIPVREFRYFDIVIYQCESKQKLITWHKGTYLSSRRILNSFS